MNGSRLSPQMLLKLLTYGYLTQRFSSQRISAACREDLALMWLAHLASPPKDIRDIFS